METQGLQPTTPHDVTNKEDGKKTDRIENKRCTDNVNRFLINKDTRNPGIENKTYTENMSRSITNKKTRNPGIENGDITQLIF